jgi:uncharacterized phage protein (TIGR02220 family)
MRDKKTLVLFIENREYIDQLSNDQAGRLTKAIFAYEEEGAVPDFSDDITLSILFGVMKKQLDYMDEQYAKSTASKSEAGKKGMATRWDKKASDNNDITDDNTTITENNRVITEDNTSITDDNNDITDDNISISVSKSVSKSLSAYADINKLSGKPDGAGDAGSESRKKKPEPKADKYAEEIEDVVLYLNEKADKHFLVRNGSTQKLIRARLEEGRSVGDFKTIIDNKVKQWLGTENDKYLRPETLFAAKHFDSYLNENPAVIVPVGNAPPQGSRPLIEDEDAFLAQFR